MTAAGGPALAAHGVSRPRRRLRTCQPCSSCPTGFGVSVFASGLTGARLMAVSPEGTLVVARRAEVVALPDADGDGVAEPRVLFSNMTYAHSVAFANGYLYIATTPAVLRVRWANGAPVGQPEAIVELPSDKPSIHTSRSLRIGPDGRLYVTMGSSCNACVEPDARRTTMMVFDADGRNGRVFATGLRNAVGFDWEPRTGRLWAGDPGIDGLGDDTPSDEINHGRRRQGTTAIRSITARRSRPNFRN